MVSIARKNLFQERTRLLISVGGVALAVMLILILTSLYQGWRERVTAYVDHVRADLWVSQEGASDMFHAGSFLANSVEGRLRRIRGVKQVYRYVGRQVSFDLEGREAHTYLVGFDPEANIAGPVRMVSGNPRPGPGEIVIDQVFARNNGLRIGDILEINERRLRIVGLSDGGNMIIYQFSFTALKEAERVLQMNGYANFFIVQLEDARQAAAMADRIERRVSGVDALMRGEFRENNSRIITESFLPIIAVLVVIAFAVGSAVIGQTIYTATVEKSREYGVLKAIGATNRRLYLIVFQQALAAGLLGYAAGALLSAGLVRLIERAMPAFMSRLTVNGLAWVLVAAVGMSLLAAFIPSQRIARIDPAEAFRA